MEGETDITVRRAMKGGVEVVEMFGGRVAVHRGSNSAQMWR